MPNHVQKFSYYRNLSAQQKRIYDRSDAVTAIKLPYADRFTPYLKSLEKTLLAEDKTRTQEITQRIADGLCRVFGVPYVRMRVLARRPSRSWGEMHGLYEFEEGRQPVLTVWMRTAKRKQVVAFRTFLRTVIHEFTHHLDYSWLKLEDSFHTQGFYKRESMLVRLLLGEQQQRESA